MALLIRDFSMHFTIPTAILSGALLVISAQAASLDAAFTGTAAYAPGNNRDSLRQIEAAVAASITNQALRGPIELGLIRLLTEPATPEARTFACEQLAIIGSTNALPVLIALLADSNTVGMACFALGAMRSPAANPALRSSLAVARGEHRIQIINTLGDLRDPESVPPLALIARSADSETAAAVIAALGKIGDEPAQAQLTSLRSETRQALAPAFGEAFLRVAERRAAETNRTAARNIYQGLLARDNPESVRRGAFMGLLSLQPDGGMRNILSLMEAPESELLPTAIAAVAGLSGEDVSRTFGAELPNLRPEVQVLLIEALAARGDDEARSAIANRTADEFLAVRLAAMDALGEFSGPTAAEPLITALVLASAPGEVAAAQTALIRLPPDNAVDQALLTQLGTAPPPVRPSLIQVLGRRHARLAWTTLLADACSAEVDVRRAAWQALGRLATAADVASLLDCLNRMPPTAETEDAEMAIARSLQEIADAEVRSKFLCSALGQAASVKTRCALVRLLPQAADSKSLAAIESATRDPNSQVADTAMRALAHWPDPQAWDLLWRTYTGDSMEPHRALALRALVRLAEDQNNQADSNWVARYRALLENARQNADRKLILGALSGVALPEALDLALNQLGNPDVRDEAVLAVKRIAGAIKDTYPDAAREALQRVE